MLKRGSWTRIETIRRTMTGLGLAVALHAGSAFGATFDIADGDVTGLVNALGTANANGEADVINLAPAGTYTLTAVNNSTSGDNGLPAILADSGNPLFINGRGATVTRDGAAPDFRILLINGGNLTLKDATISNGRSTSNYNGGGIRANGTLILNNCTISGNTAVGGNADAGGLDVRSGQTATVNNSTFTGNSAGRGGGGINVYGTLILRNSTVTGNSAPNGGGINSSGTATLLNSTVASNTTPGYGGGIRVTGGTFSIQNAIVADNTAGTDPDLSGSVNSDFSLIEDPSGATLTGSNNITLQDPNLGALQNNGGPTQTMLPGAGPALDAGDNTLAAGLLVDQRLLGRVANGTVDLGAVESGAAALSDLVVDNATDEDDGDFGAGDLSLREAVGLANANGGSTAITFDPALTAGGDATLNLSIVGDTNAGPSALGISADVSITGPSTDNGITIARDGAAGDMRLFYVGSGGDLTLSNLTLSNGRAVGGNGGGTTAESRGGGGGAAGLGGAGFVNAGGTLNLVQSTLTGNTAIGGLGGQGSNIGGSGGGGGGGLGGNGANSAAGTGGNGGGPNSGTGGAPSNPGTVGGFGGGGGGGGYSTYGVGGNGGWGGGGGSRARSSLNGNPPSSVGGFGGGGGFNTYGSGSGAGGLGGGSANTTNGSGGGGAGLGGAVFNNGGMLNVTNTTISGNSAQGGLGGAGTANGGLGLGGGIFNRDGTLTVSNATITENQALDSGGTDVAAGGRAIYNLGDGDHSGGDPATSDTGSADISNSILGQSDTDAEDFTGNAINAGTSTTSGSGNLIRTQSGFTGGILLTDDPVLDALADNGGPTFTHLPVEGSSPAIDAIATGEAGDQRGITRPQGSNFDIGAVEVESPTIPGTGLALKSLRMTSNWRRANSDRVTLAVLFDNPGAVPAPGAAYPFAGSTVDIDIGGQVFNLVLDAKGKDTATNGRTLKVKYLKRTNQLLVVLRSPLGDYQDQWLDEGLTNAPAASLNLNVPISILFDATTLNGNVRVRWWNRLNAAGNAIGQGLDLGL